MQSCTRSLSQKLPWHSDLTVSFNWVISALSELECSSPQHFIIYQDLCRRNLCLPNELWLPLSSVQFSRSVESDSLWPQELQHTRPPCPSPTPGVHPNSCPLSRWCHPAISSSVVPFSSCSQSLAASESFPMSQLFALDGQSIGVSASASVPPMNTQSDLL